MVEAKADLKRDSFGQRLRRLRTERGFRQCDLARELGVSKVTLWKWETDQVRPRARSLERLDEVLGCPPTDSSLGTRISPALPLQSSSSLLKQAIDRHKSQIAALAGARPEDVAIRISFGNWNIHQEPRNGKAVVPRGVGEK